MAACCTRPCGSSTMPAFDRLLLKKRSRTNRQWMAVMDRLRRASCINTDTNIESEVLHGE